MQDEVKELKSERKIEKREIKQNNLKKKGLIVGAVAGSAVALALGLGLGLGLNKEPKYRIDVNSSLSIASPTGDGKYEIGDEVIIEAEEIPGYRFDHWEFNGNEITSNPYIFELTEDKIGEYTAVYEEEYTITLSTIENGSVSVVDNKTNAIYEEEVELLVTPNTNYALNKLYYIEEDSETQVIISNLTFTMPANNITIYAEFVEIEYTAAVSNTVQNGSVTLSQNGGIVGTEITVTVTPDEGYELTRLYFTTTSTEFDILEDDGYHFTMPAENVIVYAEFTLKQYTLGTIPSQVTVKKGEETLTSNSIITHGDELTITYTETEGYTKTNFTVTGAALVTENTYTVIGNISITYSEVELSNYSLLTLNVDGEETSQYIAKNSVIYSSIPQIDTTGTYTNDEYTCGFYLDEDLTIALSEDETITENTTVYTKKATIDKLTFTFSSSTFTVKGNDSTVTEIVIPKAYKYTSDNQVYPVTGIAYRAFYNYTELIKVIIPSNISILGSSVFNGCTKLKIITLKESNKLTIISNAAFENCTSLENVIIPSSVTTIEGSAFSGCKSLKDITLPSNVITIIGSSFQNCESLTEISIPKSVTSIGDNTFYGCTNLNSVSFENYSKLTTLGIQSFYGCTSLTEITIPENVTSIGKGTFQSCTSLTKVNITSNIITTIENSLFNGCTNLIEITIPESVTSIGNGVFFNCKSIKSITIPLNVASIGIQAFSNCINLASIKFEEKSLLTNIEDRLFQGCTSLTEITIPESVTSIVSESFSGCTSLAKITIPEGVTEIGYATFYNCTSLTEINIPSSVTSIGNKIFFGCSSLTKVTINSSYAYTTATSTTAFGYLLNKATTINVLASIVDDTSNTNTFLNDTAKYTKSTEKTTIDGKEYYTYTIVS